MLVPASFLFAIVMVELLCSVWLRFGGKSAAIQEVRPPSPYYSWQEVARFAREDKGHKGEVARELVRLGVLDYESKPLRRNFELLNEPTDFSFHPKTTKDGFLPKNLDKVIVLRGRRTQKEKVRYHVKIDDHHRRSTGHPVSPEKENMVFFGCSFTFGDGLNVEDTIPFLMARELPVNTYNLGFSGGSPVRNYIALKEHGKTLLGDLNGKPVTAVYTFIDDQVRRNTGTSKWFGTAKNMHWLAHQVYLDGDELKYYKRSEAGFFDFLWFRYLFGVSSFARVFALEIPFIGEAELELFARTVLGIKEEAAKLVPLRNFVFVFYPGQSFYAPRLIPHLKKLGISYIDLSEIPPHLLNGREMLPADHHPTGEMNRIFSHFLALALRKS